MKVPFDADDYSIEEDILIELNEVESADSSPEITLVSQIDRHGGGFEGDGDRDSTRRYLISSDFCIWAIGNYPDESDMLRANEMAGAMARVLNKTGLDSPLEWYDEPAFIGPYYLA